jgi:FtsP/CotA-like multicopper oxidase with cupredoxin domain
VFLPAALALALLAGPPPVPAEPPDPTTRTTYLAAVEVEWDYAPAGRDVVMGMPFGPQEETFVASGPHRIGRVYTKALYRAYTDSTFTTPVPVEPEWEHLGTVGPVLRAVVGDTLRVVFRNQTRFPFSVHPHGVFYAKDSEGAAGADGTSGPDILDDRVPPGGTHTYVWPVPERAGPGPDDPSSVVWLYHSHVSSPNDTNAGLIGAIVVTARDQAREDATPADVDREFVTLFKIYDENLSPYLDANLRAHAGDPEGVDLEDEGFVESNLLHAINGYVYGNMPLMTMRIGERVRWYVLGLGNEADIHTAHWHGNTGLEAGHRTDTVGVLPGLMLEVDMIPDNPGTWMFHCHVDDHILGGMQALYQVLPGG